MSPFLKGLIGVFVGIVLIVVLAVAALVLSFDPNDHKGKIQAEVAAKTGRELQISGDLALSLFPWLGVKAKGLSLANTEGFTDPQLASIEAVDVRLRLLPLFRGQVEVGRIILHGLHVNLERKADGQANWDDPQAGSRSEPDASAGQAGDDSAGGLSGFRIEGIEIRDAALQWRDPEGVIVVRGLNLETGVIAEAELSDLHLTLALVLADETQVELDLASQWQFALAGPSIAMDGFLADVRLRGAKVPAGEQRLQLRVNAQYDGALQRADLRNGRITLAGQNLDFGASMRDLSGAMHSTLELELKQFDLRALLQALAVDLPDVADAWPALDLVFKSEAELGPGRVPVSRLDLAWGELQLASKFEISDLKNPTGTGDIHLAPLNLHAFLDRLGIRLRPPGSAGTSHLDLAIKLQPDALTLDPVKGALAGESLQGKLSVSSFAKPAIRAQFALAGLSVADWLPPADSAAADAPASPPAQDINSLEVPLQWAQDLDLTARVELKRLNANGVKFSNVLWTADARPGREVKQRLSAQAYGGELILNNSLDPRAATPRIGLDLSAKAVGLGDLLADGWGRRWLDAKTELGLSLKSQGATIGQLRAATKGDASYRLTDGQIAGVSLFEVLKKASAKLTGASYAQASDSTSFQELAGRAIIESGQLRLGEFTGGSQWFKLAGEGVVDLFADRYDLRLAPVLLDTDAVRRDKILSRLIGVAIPVAVTGPLTAPKFQVDLDGLLKQQARDKADQKLEEKKEELRDKFNEKLGDFLRKR